MSLSFSLTKWHMDVVAEDGEAVVVYAAELRFAALHVHYASVLHSRGPRVHATSSMRKALPTQTADSVTWASRATGTKGTWHAEGKGTRETLLLEEGRSVEWSCHMPLARAEVELDGGRIVRGMGYVEELRLDVAPWSLPIEELRWGRFTAEAASVVWLDWKGPRSKRVVLKNGARVEGTVDERTVDIIEDEARVHVDDGRVLREGTLGASALAAFAELHAVLPTKLLGIRERSTCAPAVLEQPFMTPIKGWVISESLRWP